MFLLSIVLSVLVQVPAPIEAPPAKVSPPSNAATTAEAVARTLERLGERDIAARFRDDFRAGRVRFGVIRQYLVFENYAANAVVDSGAFGFGGARANTLTIARRFERVGAEVNRARPYAPSSPLVRLAAIVVHEYVHMDQQRPTSAPASEDPAYRHIEASIGTWLRRIAAELDAVRRLPASSFRDKALEELGDLAEHVRAEAGTNKGEIAGKVAPGAPWRWDAHVHVATSLRERISALKTGKGDLQTAQ